MDKRGVGTRPNLGKIKGDNVQFTSAVALGQTMWRGLISHYREHLPVTDATPNITLCEGNTPSNSCAAVWPRKSRPTPSFG